MDRAEQIQPIKAIELFDECYVGGHPAGQAEKALADKLNEIIALLNSLIAPIEITTDEVVDRDRREGVRVVRPRDEESGRRARIRRLAPCTRVRQDSPCRARQTG